MASTTTQKSPATARHTDRRRESAQQGSGSVSVVHEPSSASNSLRPTEPTPDDHAVLSRSAGKLNPSFSKADSKQADDSEGTPIQRCVQQELRLYFDTLDGEEPSQLYRLVIKQAEQALIDSIMQECRGNQTRAALWLGISRGNLRAKLADMEKK